MTTPTYRFENCRLVRVIDGDTFIDSIDVGFGFTTTQRIRLLGCDMPERREPGGKEAAEALQLFLMAPERLVIETVKADSFGRWLAHVSGPSRMMPGASEYMLDWLQSWKAGQGVANG